MRYELSVPARINILGNPSDALEGDHSTISAAIDLRAGARIQDSDAIIVEGLERKAGGELAVAVAQEYRQAPPLPYDGTLDLVKAAINRLYAYSPELRQKWTRFRPHLSTWTDVPRCGLAGSSLFVLLTLAGLRALYNLDPYQHNDYILCEITQRVEELELGITCGFADRYVPLFGGLAYMDYRGKLLHKAIGEEPYVTYEKLDDWVKELPLVIAHTGVSRDSGNVHSVLRRRYLQEYERLQAGAIRTSVMVRIMEQVGSTAWRGKVALLQNDLPQFGRLMSENHRLVNEMMEYCGFTEGAGWANNLLIEAAMANGALGAKLTGAGGGGSVFALTSPGDEERVSAGIQRAAADKGLTGATVFRARLSRAGLIIQQP